MRSPITAAVDTASRACVRYGLDWDGDLAARLVVAGLLWASLQLFASANPMRLMALAAPAVFYSAWPILRLGAAGIPERRIRMETLLSLGILADYGYSVIVTLRGDAPVYFGSVCAIVTLVLAGTWIERTALAKTRVSLARLVGSLPTKALVVARDGREQAVPVEELTPGEWFLVHAGERIPADGEVIAGDSEADESIVTGESTPIIKGEGDAVIAGTMNLTGTLTVRAARTAADRTLARMVHALEHALASRATIERAADRVARVFVPAVAAIAIATCAALWLAGRAAPPEAVARGIAVLLIACPCALGIITPLTITAAVSAASRHGVFVTHAEALESVPALDFLVLDKTGTVTMGDGALVDAPPDGVLRMLAAVEQASPHAIGRAIVAAARRRGLVLPIATFVEIEAGFGIRGYVDGRLVVIGNRAFVDDIGQDAEWQALSAERVGHTAVFYRIGRDPVGALVFDDTLRHEAVALVRRAQADGMRVLLLSGDSAATTHAIAARIGADEYAGGLSAAEKVDLIRKRQGAGRTVVMIGDGEHDAAALAQADLGIAVGSGAGLTAEKTMVLVRGDLDRVADTFALARRMLRVARQNLFWACGCHIVGIGLAVGGLLHPVAAAGGLVLSSVAVIRNSKRVVSARL
jgi:heavy metal translocating P-type ATPase